MLLTPTLEIPINVRTYLDCTSINKAVAQFLIGSLFTLQFSFLPAGAPLTDVYSP